MALKIVKFDSISNIFACGGYIDGGDTYAAIWRVDPNTRDLIRFATLGSFDLYFREITFSESDGGSNQYIYTTTNDANGIAVYQF